MKIIRRILEPFKLQPDKMVKHIQAIRRLLPTNCLSVFDHFVGLALTGLMFQPSRLIKLTYGSLSKYIALNSNVTVNRKNINWTAMKLSPIWVFHQICYMHFIFNWYSLDLGSSIQYALKVFRKTNISYTLIRTRRCAYQEVRNASSSENFAYVLNGWTY